MIKVICIDASAGNYFAPPFKEGDILTQSEVPNDLHIYLIEIGVNPDDACLIEEFPTYEGNWSLWPKERFIPLSNIDETKIKEHEYRTA
jgi:hypothetical protein